MVRDGYGEDMVDKLVDEADPPSGGAYTAVGTYPMEELADLLTVLSRESGRTQAELLVAYGQRLFGRLAAGHPEFMKGHEDAFLFLAGIEEIIHVEVRKLYPDAELPRFGIHWPEPDLLEMTYRSERGLEDLAEGLMRGCLSHFEQEVEINRDRREDGSVLFSLSRTQNV